MDAYIARYAFGTSKHDVTYKNLKINGRGFADAAARAEAKTDTLGATALISVQLESDPFAA